MVVRGFLGAAVLFATVALSATAVLSRGAGASQANRCGLGGRYVVRSVAPYETVENAGSTSTTQLRGAVLTVLATEGLTREWLQRLVSYRLSTGECDVGVPDATVSVLPLGDAFSVRIAGRDERAGAQILSHAQQMAK
jgi:hypothetical protein